MNIASIAPTYLQLNNGSSAHLDTLRRLATQKNTTWREARAYAEPFAELCRDEDSEYRAAEELDQKIGESVERLIECIALRNHRSTKYVRDEIPTLCESIRNMRVRRAEMGSF